MVALYVCNRVKKGIFTLINSVFVDFSKTFGKGNFLVVEPKYQRSDKNDPKSPMVQGSDGNGNFKWTATIAVRIQQFEQAKMENINITLTSPKKPYEAMPVGTMVTVDGLEMGTMKQDRGGFSQFFSAENIRPAAQERVAAGQ